MKGVSDKLLCNGIIGRIKFDFSPLPVGSLRVLSENFTTGQTLEKRWAIGGSAAKGFGQPKGQPSGVRVKGH